MFVYQSSHEHRRADIDRASRTTCHQEQPFLPDQAVSSATHHSLRPVRASVICQRPRLTFTRLEHRQACEEVIEALHGRMVRGWNDTGSRISVRFADSNAQRELRVRRVA
jgi:hypothetical protein